MPHLAGRFYFELDCDLRSEGGAEPEISYVRYRYHEEWSLSEDGKTLTIVRKIEREDMPMVKTTVLTRAA